MFNKLRASVRGLFAASDLPPSPLPAAKGKSRSVGSYLKSAKPNPNSSLLVNDRQLAKTDLAAITRTQETRTLIRQFAHSSPDVSAAMFAYVRVGVSGNFRAIARNPDGTTNRDATKLVQQLLTRFDLLPTDPKFAGYNTIRSLAESFAKELYMHGGCSAELVLGKDYLPSSINPISIPQVEFRPDGNRLKPIQRIAGQVIDLDVPTFFYVTLDREIVEAYPSSPIEATIKPTIFSEQFVADLNRVVRRAVHPRLSVKIIEEKFKENLPDEVVHDPDALESYLNDFIVSLADRINNLQPEEAFVFFDSIGIELINNGNSSLSSEYEVLSGLVRSQVTSGAKTLPAILGSESSSNIASTQTLLFMKYVEGAIQAKLNELFSKILTLAVRLFGQDVYVEFAFDPIELRPKAEMEAFMQTRQSRILELLSLGLITDEDACIALTGELPPEGAKPLSGTGFKSAAGNMEPGKDGSTNSGSTLNQNLNPDTPAQGRGSNKKNDPQKVK